MRLPGVRGCFSLQSQTISASINTGFPQNSILDIKSFLPVRVCLTLQSPVISGSWPPFTAPPSSLSCQPSFRGQHSPRCWWKTHCRPGQFFWGTSILFSTVATPVYWYIPTNSVGGFREVLLKHTSDFIITLLKSFQWFPMSLRKKKKKNCHMILQSNSWAYIWAKRYMHPCVHCSHVCNS